MMCPQRRRPRRPVSLSAVVFWLFAEALFTKLAELQHGQHEIKKHLRTIITGEKIIMAQVQIEQDDLDAVGSSLEALVDVVRQIDTSQLPDADKTALQNGLTDLTSAINDKLAPSTPVTPPADGDV